MATPAPKRLSTGRRTALAIWLVLAAAYLSTLGLDSVPGHDYSVAEGHYLLSARSVAKQRNLDLGDDYASRGVLDVRSTPGGGAAPPRRTARFEFDSPALRPEGRLHKGGRYEPHSIGLPLLAAPFYALGGAKAVEAVMAVLLALAVALGYLLARRVVPDPWAAIAALALGLSPPLVAHGTMIVPEVPAAAALAGAALCVVRLRDGPSRPAAIGSFILLGSLPWFGFVFLPPALVLGLAAIRSLRKGGRGFLALAATEVAFFSLALLVGLNEAIFGGPTPHAADVAGASATGADSLADYLDRSWRIVSIFLDRHYGLLRWAPVTALVFSGLWVVYRARRERLGRAIAGLDEEHGVALLCGGAALATVVTVAVGLPSLSDGFPTRSLIPVLPLLIPLLAVGVRQTPRLALVLALIGLAGSIWLWIDARSGGGLVAGRPKAPWGPLLQVFPEFSGGVWPYVLLVAVIAALAAPVVRQELEIRHRLG